MSSNLATLKTTVFITSFFLAGAALAQGAPEGGVAPATVDLEDDSSEPATVEPADVDLDGGATASATGAVALGGDASGSTGESSAASVVLGGEDTSGATVSGVDVGTGGWQFGYHGYFRAPFMMGIASREDTQRTGAEQIDPTTGQPTGVIIPPPGSRTTGAGGLSLYGQTNVVARDYDPEKAYKKTTLHIPQIPDNQYLSWQATSHNRTDWAELFFSVGNSIAEGTVSVEGYNFTQAAYTDPETQFGVAQGYVTIRPEVPWQNVQIWAKAGAHWNRYGMAGRYDAGEYDTYLYGRTKTTGVTVGEQIQADRVRLRFEEGFGGHRPHPSQYNTAKYTLLAHGHAFVEYQGLMVGLHLLHSWAQEEDRDGQGCPGPGGYNDTNGLPTTTSVCSIVWGPPLGGSTAAPVYPVGAVAGFGSFGDGGDGNIWLPDGHMTVLGPEIKWDSGAFGLFYLGYSLINAKNALTVSPAIEVLHSNGGGEFSLGVTNNYLDNPQCNPAKGECSSGGNGQVHTFEFQYEFSLMNLIKGLEDGSRFWGEGQDFVAKLYAMYNIVNSKYDPHFDGSLGVNEPYGGLGVVYRGVPNAPQSVAAAGGNYWQLWGDNYSKHSQLKFGTDLYASLFSSFAAGLRADHVRPNNHIAQQAFTVISPRIEFRSRWVTREKFWIQYSRYIYAKRSCDTLTPYNDSTQPRPSVSASPDFDYTGSPQNFSGMPLNQECVQLPSGPRLPDGWGATALETPDKWRGAPITGGNPNNTRPDENVVSISASMWW